MGQTPPSPCIYTGGGNFKIIGVPGSQSDAFIQSGSPVGNFESLLQTLLQAIKDSQEDREVGFEEDKARTWITQKVCS